MPIAARLSFSLGLLLLAAIIRGGDFSQAELNALYYADLGPATLDVSDYPKEQQENYAVFQRVCSVCHTPARALNSSRTSAEAWEVYVFDMWRQGIKHGHHYTLEEAKAAKSFLVYDSRRRKIDNRDFEELTSFLQNRFAGTIAERLKRAKDSAH